MDTRSVELLDDDETVQMTDDQIVEAVKRNQSIAISDGRMRVTFNHNDAKPYFSMEVRGVETDELVMDVDGNYSPLAQETFLCIVRYYGMLGGPQK